MPLLSVEHVKVSGLAAAVPVKAEDNAQNPLLSELEREKFIKTVGIRYRRVAPTGVTSSDLCYEAARKLIEALQWKPEEIDFLVYVTQTPDYFIPNTASVLQQRLQLHKNCMAFDVNLGCSGYVYGLSIAGSLLQNKPKGKALLLVGDVSTAVVSPKDKSTQPLFSDAGSATALEFALGHTLHFNLQNDGNGHEDIMMPGGAFRNPFTTESLEFSTYDSGIERTPLHMKLDGLKIFNFALREIAPNIKDLLTSLHRSMEDVDFCVMHQANLLMLESVRKKLNLEASKVPYSLYDFGNTSSASIPVTLITQLREPLQHHSLQLVLAGFGVGLSWGSVYLHTNSVTCLPLIEV